MRMLLLSIVFAVAASGCATVPVNGTNSTSAPTPLVGVASVRVAKSDAPLDFVEVGPIDVSDGEGCGVFGTRGTYEAAYALLKQKAAARGADYVQIMDIQEPYLSGNCAVNTYLITATLYRSPELAAKASVAAVEDAKKRCVAQELPEWEGANAATKRALLDRCRAPAEAAALQ